jgi:hypothetical protein
MQYRIMFQIGTGRVVYLRVAPSGRLIVEIIPEA